MRRRSHRSTGESKLCDDRSGLTREATTAGHALPRPCEARDRSIATACCASAGAHLAGHSRLVDVNAALLAPWRAARLVRIASASGHDRSTSFAPPVTGSCVFAVRRELAVRPARGRVRLRETIIVKHDDLPASLAVREGKSIENHFSVHHACPHRVTNARGKAIGSESVAGLHVRPGRPYIAIALDMPSRPRGTTTRAGKISVEIDPGPLPGTTTLATTRSTTGDATSSTSSTRRDNSTICRVVLIVW
jgi:hypothetical protein